MHENNLLNRINLIFTSLKCNEIIEFLNQWNIDKLRLLTLVIESKIGYDRLITDNECKKFIDDIEEHTVYTTSEYSELIMFISTMGDVNTKFNSGSAILNKFQVFHKMLYKTGTLVLKLMNDKPVETIPVSDRNAIVNPLFNGTIAPQTQIASPSYIPNPAYIPNPGYKPAPNYTTQPKPATIAAVAPAQPAPIEDNKVFSINSPKYAEPQKSNESDDLGEMSLTSFLKSLATG